MPRPSIQDLKETFNYDPETGVFTRAKAVRGKCIGSVAGCSIKDGRRVVSVNRVKCYAHHAAWAYVYGEWPTSCIDHINGVNHDNRISNLRLATHAENMQNFRRARSDSRSGLIGAMPHQGRWRSDIKLCGKKTYLGTFDTKEEAHAAYVAAKRRLHPFGTL